MQIGFRSGVMAAAVAAIFTSGAVGAEGLLDNIRKGAKKTGEAVQGGASSVGEAVGKGAGYIGDTVGKGADYVGKTVDSTTDLVTNEETPEATRAELDAAERKIVERLRAENPQAGEMLDFSAGHAAFDTRSLTVFPVTAGYGRGVAVSHNDGSRIYMNMTSGGAGAAFGIGGFATQFVILFETQADFDSFVTYGYDATAEAGALYGDDKTNEGFRFVNGRSIFVLSKTGWRVAASATGTKYWPAPQLN
ncbi:hypothetical protein [Primorskyibacter sp. S87]|uniref:hypothetical protein n=1 Tax=Primorskyibacter sp. S87 TaxID=3415126 RepID=UPI003C7D1040